MIACPKCGFVQPPDQFCASCGVDMEKYQARMAPSPWYKRAAANYLAQTLLILAIVIFTSVAIHRKKRSDLVARLAPPPPPTLQQPAVPKPVAQPQRPNRLVDPGETRVETPRPPPPPPPLQAADVNATTKAGDEEKKPAPMLQVFLAEASLAYLNRMGDVRPLSSQGPTGGALVTNLSSRLQAGRSTQEIRPLVSRRLPLRMGQPTHFSKTALDEMNTPLGIDVELTPTSLDDRGLHLQLTVTRSLRETSESPPQPYRYVENVTLTNDSGVFIYGLIPRRRPYPTENLLPEALQDVMQSPEFLSGTVDLVLFVQGYGIPR